VGASLGLRSVIRLRSCVGETADIVEESPDDVDFFLPLPFVLGLDAEPSALLVVRFALVTGCCHLTLEHPFGLLVSLALPKQRRMMDVLREFPSWVFLNPPVKLNIQKCFILQDFFSQVELVSLATLVPKRMFHKPLTKCTGVFVVFVVFLTVYTFSLCSSNFYSNLREAPTFKLINKARPANVTRRAIIFPETPDMDLSFIQVAVEENPFVEVFGYPYASPQIAIGTLPHLPEFNRIPKNKANEAMVYLTFIIDNYFDLPDVMLFIHFALNYNPKNQLTKMLKNLKWDEVTHFLSLENCYREIFSEKRQLKEEELPNRTGYEEKAFTLFLSQNNWEKYGLINDGNFIVHGCCAQFVVPKAAVSQLPLEFYVDMQKWILKTKMPPYYSAKMFEFSWHWFFTRKTSPMDTKEECKKILGSV
jgi:hypothetical protein